METEQEIKAHNERALWRDAENHLRIAKECLEQAQSAMDDLNVPHISENLTPTIEAVERFRSLAEEKTEQ